MAHDDESPENETPDAVPPAAEVTPEAAEPQAAPEAVAEQPAVEAGTPIAEVAAEPGLDSAEGVEGSSGEEAEGLAHGLDIGGEAAVEEIRVPLIVRGRLDKDGTAMGTGRRKTAVARVRLKRGTGKFTVNNRQLDDFFCIERDRLMLEAPLRVADMLGQVDVWVRVSGGGTSGQAGAIILGIARALQALNPELHGKLSDGGFLTRDDRMVERKKYGHKKARRSFQFSKR
jgi:small subunit ribosomal protein S9